jgi:sugar/nucleoside kinase (ribokinase family)
MPHDIPAHKILFTGLNTIDLQFPVSEFPAHNGKAKAFYNEINVGGPATNAAIACAHLGGNADLLTPIGKHLLTAFVEDDLKKFNIRLFDPLAGSERKPVFASIITSASTGERTVYSYYPDKEDQDKYNLNLNLNDYSLVMFDGFHPELAIQIAKICREKRITTVLDGGSWKPRLDEMLMYLDIAVCSDDFHVPSGDAPADVFDYLHAAGIKDVAITRGEKSILYSRQNSPGEIVIPTINVTDTLGAGDIFHGAFCHYFMDGNDFVTSLRLASRVAAHSCQTTGTRQWMFQPVPGW